MMRAANSLNILCFGDSLTAGFTGVGSEDHPYGWFLQASLEKAFPSWNITTHIQGAGGDQVTSPPGNYLPRMSMLYNDPGRAAFDYAIVLGGTNDLCLDRRAADIWPYIKELWSIPLSHGTDVLSLTVPECGHCTPIINAERESFNSLILSHQAENFHVFDLFSAIPYWNMPISRRNQIWADTIHFTPKGYDLLGSLLTERLIRIIKSSKRFPEEMQNSREELKKRVISTEENH